MQKNPVLFNLLNRHSIFSRQGSWFLPGQADFAQLIEFGTFESDLGYVSGLKLVFMDYGQGAGIMGDVSI